MDCKMKKMLSDIFKDIISGCNRLISSTLTRPENPKDSACNRLRLVLMHDRTKLDPATLERMRDELVEVISKYVEIDKELLNIDLASEGNEIALVASIPVIRAKQQLPESQTSVSSDENHPNLYDHEDDEFDEEHVIIEDSIDGPFSDEEEDDDWDDFFVESEEDVIEVIDHTSEDDSDETLKEEPAEEETENADTVPYEEKSSAKSSKKKA